VRAVDLFAAVFLASAPALAQEVTPPALTSRPAPEWPHGEPPRDGAVVVVVVDVSTEGLVTDVTVESGATPRIDEAAIAAARSLRFTPARRGDLAVAARVRLSIAFVPPREEAPALAAIRGTVLDRRTRQPLGAARVEIAGRPRSAIADALGRFSISTEPGAVEVHVSRDGYRAIASNETLVAGEALDVRYALEPALAETYETVVVAPEREEVSRRTLERVEVTQTPGTMGDPFRVIETLPGVVPMLTGVPYYYIRGAPPADTGYFVDGVEVPALFHLALGPSVLHPSLVDRVDFYSGGAPARYPGFVGGIVGATTAPLPRDRMHVDADVRLVDAGGIVAVPFDEGRTRTSVSGRYSYTAALLSAIVPEAVVDYWDYQVRAERDTSPDNTARVLAFGSYDLIGERDLDDGSVTTDFAQVFHRMIVRDELRLDGGRRLEVGGAIGFEQILIRDGIAVREYTAGPHVTYARSLGSDADLQVGLDGTYAYSDYVVTSSEDGDGGLGDLFTSQDLWEVGAFAEVDYRISRELTLLPGVRVAAITNGERTFPAADPRFGFRRALSRSVTLKGSLGWYHQRPAFVIPLPGFDAIDLDRGLQRSIQASQGIEWQAPFGLSLDAQVFFHRYDNLSDIDMEAEGFPRLGGNAYGLELIVRRALTDKLFGWVAYTLSRSERNFPAHGGDGPYADEPFEPAVTAPSDFDRTHVANLVLSYELPRKFRVGGRLQYRSGRPYTPTIYDDYASERVQGERNSERMPGYAQLDLRIDKRWTYASWDLDLYFEFINVTFSRDVLSAEERCNESTGKCTTRFDEGVPIVIPTLGVRGVF
jgi:TonB family protein